MGIELGYKTKKPLLKERKEFVNNFKNKDILKGRAARE